VQASAQPQADIFSPAPAASYAPPQGGAFAPPPADPYAQPQASNTVSPAPYPQPAEQSYAPPADASSTQRIDLTKGNADSGQGYAPPAGAPPTGPAYPPPAEQGYASGASVQPTSAAYPPAEGQGYVPPASAQSTGSAYPPTSAYPSAAGQGYAPPVGAPPTGSAYPPVAGQGYAPPAGAPPTGSAYPPVAGQPPKKKTGLIVGIIIAVVLVICVGLGIGGYLIYQGVTNTGVLIDNSTGNNTGTNNNGSSDGILDGNNNNGSSNNSGNTSRAPSIPDGEVVVDSDVLTLVVDTNGGVVDNILDWYEVDCVVVNKTNTTLGIYFDYDDTTTDNGFVGSDIIIMPEGNYYDFLPNETLAGVIVFMIPSDISSVTSVTNLKGTLIVYDLEADNLDTIAEYPVSIAKL
jgi:hypothetical protein